MKNILIIGAGRFGSFATMKLHDLGHQTLVIDKDENRINRILPYASEARIGDSTDEGFMKTIGVHSYDVCLVSIGDDFLSSLQTTFTLSELGAKKVIARATSSRQEKFLLRNGADASVTAPTTSPITWSFPTATRSLRSAYRIAGMEKRSGILMSGESFISTFSAYAQNPAIMLPTTVLITARIKNSRHMR